MSSEQHQGQRRVANRPLWMDPEWARKKREEEEEAAAASQARKRHASEEGGENTTAKKRWGEIRYFFTWLSIYLQLLCKLHE